MGPMLDIFLFGLAQYPHLSPAARSADSVRESRMVRILCKSEEKNVQHGTSNVTSARLEATTEKHVTNALIVANGATNPRITGGVRQVGTSKPRIMMWVLCSQR